ncbi:MAG: hypothetical protein HDQ97_02910 [Lachnospiraceae bacterium]|nr:hypothetical protein [Lachnospiraceae bacterium]
MKKKFLTLALAAMLTLSVTACGGKDASTSAESKEAQTEESDASSEGEETEEADAPKEVDALTAAMQNMSSVTNMEGQMVIEMDVEISADGQSQSIASVITMNMTVFGDPMKLKVEANADMGEEGSVQQSIYGEITEDGTAIMYIYDGEEWYSQVVGAADMLQYDAGSSMISLIDNESMYKLEGMEKVNGASAFKYSCVTSGEEAKQQILSTGAMDSFASLGFDLSRLELLWNDVGDLTEYVWIDKASLYPVKCELDMTQIMDTLMSSMIESLGEQAKGLDVGVSKMKISMTCSNFNNAADFTIPEEAKAE